MKKILYIFTILCAAIALHSCTDDNASQLPSTAVDGDQIHLNFSVQVPDMKKVTTRALDPTGTGVNVLWLFNFDKQGVFIGRVRADLTSPQGQTSGTFTASIPSTTRIVHLIANQNLDGFHDDAMLGTHENTVMNGLVSTSGGIVYWGRVANTEAEDANTFATAFEAEVPLYRNMARITVSGFSIYGLTVCNQFANGASIPFNAETSTYPDGIPEFVTLPEDRTKMSDLTDVEAEQTAYIFETPNTGNDEVSVIIRSSDTNNPRYYKILLLDDNKESLPVIRNHSYNIIFSTPPAAEDGYATFAEAKAGAAYNNALITIDDDIPSITIDGVTLGVDKTTVVCTEEGPWQLNYTYTGGESVVADWISNDGVAHTTITCTDPDTDDKGTVTITVNPITETVHRGTIRIKAGRLVRYIKVISLKEFEFTPTWVSNGIYNGKTGEDVALVFDIPSTYPEELLPVRCLITTNQLDGNGMVELSVINEEDCLKENGEIDTELYGAKNNYGYKYVYEAMSTGMHRIYFQTSLSGQTTGNIILEANYFKTLTKQFTFTNQENHQLHIIGNGNKGNGDVYMYTGETAGAANASPIYYFLAPRRAGSLVTFSLKYGASEGSDFEDLPEGETILIYTSNLIPDASTFMQEGTSTTGGGHYYIYETKEGEDVLRFYTKSPDCAETVRFASVSSTDITKAGNYKSITLELENYLQWTFPMWIGNNADNDTPQITYGTDVPVQLSFDLKMAESTHQAVTGVYDKVYPTGTYECYIYTENLTPADNTATEEGNYLDTTPYKDADGKTYYIYHVSKSTNIDNDVRTLNFKTNKIVSAETVTLQPNKEQISFVESTATFANAPITGSIIYGENNTSVPAGEFVTLIRKDGTRIGVVTITEEGKYSMTLRGEYSYGWEEPLYMYYAIRSESSTTIYSSDEITLSRLMKNSTVILPNKE